ncbi:MAG: hypothetical protein PHE89_02380 [Alphaproteobacteria bacterium]|nr:hypothetical protein [Alphaproteobacteria bacterium]
MEDKTTMSDESVSKEDLWHLNNYILLKDYYDRTISRIAARCIRKGNIAIEEYPFYGYILDVLEEICEVGDYVVNSESLRPLVEKKIAGGFAALKKNLKEYKDELMHNSSPEMIKDDNKELEKMKDLLGGGNNEKLFDPTEGAGMKMDEIVDKLMKEKQMSEHRKIVKIKKPVNEANRQNLPTKDEV